MTDRLWTLARKMAAMRPPRRLFTRRRDVQGNPIRARKAHNRSGMGRGWARIVLLDPCVYCGMRPAEGRKNTLEHVVPIASGGGPDWTNLAGACKRCNQAKGDTPLVLFLLGRERYRREVMARRGELARPPVSRPVYPPIPRHSGFKLGEAMRWK